ncbi:hypothetical protein [Streptomyces sp. Wb2n-11]|uniref:hypothetical protein n=1 Tax=Streptomyces sp. Wb2n-11 TaxID=1030533 RepID=UPI000ABF004F|nr:hypothetical protein [Streptomyces sp. Wb2n-11]
MLSTAPHLPGIWASAVRTRARRMRHVVEVNISVEDVHLPDEADEGGSNADPRVE